MTRVVSGVALGGAALAAILLLPPTGFRVLVCLVAALAAREYVRILHRDDRAPHVTPVLLLVVATCWWMSGGGQGGLLPLLLVALSWLAVEVLFLGLTVDRAAARFLALWYVGMPLGMLVAVQAAGGSIATVLLVATIVVSDTTQYYTGRLFGRRALAPTISPKKTIEGAVGGLVAATLFLGAAAPSLVAGAQPVLSALLGGIMAVLGIVGDLFESRLKRIAGVKDSSSLIPGHGGILDRIDALLFATPAFYLFLT